MQIDWSKIRAYNGRAGFRDDNTSREAASKIDAKLKPLQKTVYEAFKAFPSGAHPDMIAQHTGIDRQTVKSRFTELTDAGLLVKTKRRGKTIKGSACAIWEAV